MAAAGALGAWVAAEAFTVQYLNPQNFGITFPAHNPNHEDITRQALSDVVATLSDGSTVQFTEVAKEYVTQKVAETDSLYYNIEKVHFDSETFFDGQLRLQEIRQNVRALAFVGNFESAQEQLGQGLHSVEDFYAHSTWVEQNPSRTDVANLGRPGSIVTPIAGGGIVQSANVPTCSAQATQTVAGTQIQTGILINPAIPLTSEYFAATQEIFPNSDWRYSSSVQKCIHGISDISNHSSQIITLGIARVVQFGYGINKDDVNRDFFLKAKALATTAAQQYVNDIVDDIRANPANTTAAQADLQICGLLGWDDPVLCTGVLTPPNPQISVGEQQVFTLNFPSAPPPGPIYYWTVTGNGSIDASYTTLNHVTFTAGNTSGPAIVSVVVLDADGNKSPPKSVSFTVGVAGCFSKEASLANTTSGYNVTSNDIAPDGTINGTIQLTGTWKGNVAFSDPPYTSTANESDETTVSTYQPGSVSTVATFSSATVDASSVIYGTTVSTASPNGGGNSVVSGVLKPPLPFGKVSLLVVGGPPITLLYSGVATVARTGNSVPFSYTESWQLIATPIITTRTGLTLSTCEYQIISSTSPNNIDTKYKLYGYIFDVKEINTDTSSGTPVVTDTQEATAVSINGLPYYGP